MIALWQFYWPVLVAAVVAGVVAGIAAFAPGRDLATTHQRRMRRLPVAIGAGLVVLIALAWHDPLGRGERMAQAMERVARIELDRLEMTGVEARLHRAPLARDLMLQGVADDFQRSELVRILAAVPGVRSVSWNEARGRFERLTPVALEIVLLALLAYLIGLLLAYLVELHRRSARDWSW